MTPTAILTSSDGASDDNLGWTVEVVGDTVVGGAPRAAINSLSWAGALYIFNKPAGSWQSMTQTAKLTASTPVQGDEIGLCLGMQGNLIAAGAQITQYAAIFQRPPSGWSNMTATAQLNSPPNAYSFGTSVAVISNVVAVGAPFAPILANLGQVYLFKEPKNGWRTTSIPNAAIKAGTAGGEQDLGFSVSGSSSSGLVTGAIGYNNDAGAAYVYSLQ